MFTKKQHRFIQLALLGITILSTHYVERVLAEQDVYVMGVFPHLPARTLEKVYAPIAADLSRAIGKKVKFRTTTTYKKFMKNVNAEIFDIAMMQPFDYTMAADQYGYLPLVARDEPLATIVIVSNHSPINELSQLQGKKIALPPASAAVSRLLIIHLKKMGINPAKNVSISHYRSHASCMKQVVIGAVDACGTAAPPMRLFSHRSKVKFKIIATTQIIPHALFTVHPRISNKDRQILSNTMLSWSKTRQGKKLLQRGKLKPFIAINDKDYDVVRQLHNP